MNQSPAKPELFTLDGIETYPDYLDLLGQNLKEPDPILELIVVPQGRPAEHIESAARLAHAGGSILISLCSHDAKAVDVANFLADSDFEPSQWFAVDVPEGYAIPNVTLSAEKAIPEQCRKAPGWNLSDKRNIGLMIGNAFLSEELFFVDDDITVSLGALQNVSKMRHLRDIAGLRCGGFPDKSAIMHAKQAIIDFQLSPRYISDTRFRPLSAGQLSGNSMLVNPLTTISHFPRGIYNEDWLFAFESISAGRAGLSDEKYYQEPYDPFVAERASQEEFGDLFAEGLYVSLNSSPSPRTYMAANLQDPEFWQNIIEARRGQFEKLLASVGARRNPRYRTSLTPEIDRCLPAEKQAELIASLSAGLAVNQTLAGADFVNYLNAWDTDIQRWRKIWLSLHQRDTVGDILKDLDLTYHTNE